MELFPGFLTHFSNDSHGAMAPSRGRQLLISVFAPEGWPESVAPEYGRYQLWDTIQQALPELRNSGTLDLQRYRWWSALTNPTRLAFKSHDAYYLRWRKYLPQFRTFYLKFGESWPARIRNAPQFKFLTIFVLTTRLSKMATGNPLQNGGFSLLGKEIWAESSWALLVYGWFGGYTTQYLGILISA